MEQQTNKGNECKKHEFNALGFDVYKKTPTSIEAVACIFCEHCGLFRTKILTFRREIDENAPKFKEFEKNNHEHKTNTGGSSGI